MCGARHCNSPAGDQCSAVVLLAMASSLQGAEASAEWLQARSSLEVLHVWGLSDAGRNALAAGWEAACGTATEFAHHDDGALHMWLRCSELKLRSRSSPAHRLSFWRCTQLLVTWIASTRMQNKDAVKNGASSAVAHLLQRPPANRGAAVRAPHAGTSAGVTTILHLLGTTGALSVL